MLGWLDEKPGWLFLRPGEMVLTSGSLALRPGWPGFAGRADGWTDGQADGWMNSPFYWNSSPNGASADKCVYTDGHKAE